MEQLKLKRDFWNAFKDGSKKYEFRKLEKGIITGTYEFVDIYVTCGDCGAFFDCIEFANEDYGYCSNEDGQHTDLKHKSFGTAHLKPIAVNPRIEKNTWHKKPIYYVMILEKGCENAQTFIDKETYNFVKENYIDKHIDFIVYEVSDVKGEE